MFKNLIHGLGSLFLLMTLACSPGNQNSEDQNNNQKTTPIIAKSPEEALQKLSENHRKAFETWKSRVLKSCDSLQAFTQSDNVQNGIDTALFIQQNHHSWIFNGDHGEFAILKRFFPIPGEGESKYESTITINGKSYGLQTEFLRHGSQCTVYLFGQKVYETHISESFEVGAYWDPLKAPSFTYKTQVPSQDIQGLTDISTHGVTDILEDSLRPTQTVWQLFGKELNVSEKTARSLFRIGYFSLRHSLRATDDALSFWFNAQNRRWVGTTPFIWKMLKSSPKPIEFDLRLAIPNEGNLKLKWVIETSPVADKPDYLTYSVKFVQPKGLAHFDSNEVNECIEARLNTLQRITTNKVPNIIQPSVSDTLDACEALAEDIEIVASSQRTAQFLISRIFNSITPSSSMRYNGWDEYLSHLVLDHLNREVDLQEDLDPSHNLSFIQDLNSTLNFLKTELLKTNQLIKNKTAIYQMGLKWIFTGHKVSDNRIARILKAADNSTQPFSASTSRLLNSLTSAPNMHDSEIAFCESIDATYKTEANLALSLATQLNYSEWQKKYFDQILQIQLPLTELKTWTNRLNQINLEIQKNPNLTSVKDTLTSLAIQWMDKKEVELEQVGKIYASLNNTITAFPDSTRQLIQSLSDSFVKNKEALDFADLISEEYKKAASSIQIQATSLGLKSWSKGILDSILQKRPSQTQLNSWNTTLSAALEYTAREKIRSQEGSDFQNDNYRVSLIKTALNEGWIDADFTTLEKIAQLGKYKLSCNSYHGVSSIVNCLDFSLFSRNPQKFLDPRFNSRYGFLALEFADYENRISDFHLQNTLMTSFFGPIWTSCDESKFQAKASDLRNQIPQWLNTTDQFKKWNIEKAIQTTLENCR